MPKKLQVTEEIKWDINSVLLGVGWSSIIVGLLWLVDHIGIIDGIMEEGTTDLWILIIFLVFVIGVFGGLVNAYTHKR